MTTGAIYSYFASRDDLVTTLVGEVYESAVQAAETARDAVPESDTGSRVATWAHAMRDWALANPEGFRMIYGDPVPGYRAPEDSLGRDAALRACTGLIGLVAAAWPVARARGSHDREYEWTDFDPRLAAHVREEFPGLPRGSRSDPAGVGAHARLAGPGDIRPSEPARTRSGGRLPGRDARPRRVPRPHRLIGAAPPPAAPTGSRPATGRRARRGHSRQP